MRRVFSFFCVVIVVGGNVLDQKDGGKHHKKHHHRHHKKKQHSSIIDGTPPVLREKKALEDVDSHPAEKKGATVDPISKETTFDKTKLHVQRQVNKNTGTTTTNVIVEKKTNTQSQSASRKESTSRIERKKKFDKKLDKALEKLKHATAVAAKRHDDKENNDKRNSTSTKTSISHKKAKKKDTSITSVGVVPNNTSHETNSSERSKKQHNFLRESAKQEPGAKSVSDGPIEHAPPGHDHSWPALDNSDQDFLEDTNDDNGAWEAMTKYDKLRHGVIAVEEDMLKAKEAVDLRTGDEVTARDALMEKNAIEEKFAADLAVKRAEYDEALEVLNVIRKKSLDSKAELDEKKALLDEIERKAVNAKEEYKEAKDHYAHTKKMVESTAAFDKANALVLEKKREHDVALAQHKAALEEEHEAQKKHGAKFKALEDAEMKLHESRKKWKDMHESLKDSRRELAKFPGNDVNPWTERVGGVLQAPEVMPTHRALLAEVGIVLGVLVLIFVGIAAYKKGRDY